MRLSLRAGLPLLAALLLGIAVPLLWSGGQVLAGLRQLPWGALLIGLALIVASWCCNAGRLQLLAGGLGHPLGWWRSLGTVMATEFAICATPGGTGGPLVFTHLVGARGPGGAGALALYAFAQLSDMLVFAVALLVFAISLHDFSNRVMSGQQIWLLLPFALGVLALAAVALRHYRPVLHISGHALRGLGVSQRWRRRTARWALKFRKGLTLLVRLPRWRLALTLVLCAAHWAARYSVLFLLIDALGKSIPWAYLYAIQMIALGAGQLVPLPGGSGGVELAMSALLAPYLTPTVAAGVVLGWRFATYHWYLLAGAPVFALMAGGQVWRALWRRESAADG
jgi:uncharacterized protein (TIRG00374 family)